MAEYQTITLSPGETRNIALSTADPSQYQNVLYDVRGGEGVAFALDADATIRNVGILGSNEPVLPRGRVATFRCGWPVNATVENVFAEHYNPNDSNSKQCFMFTANSAGNLTVRSSWVAGFGNNGLYASKSDANVTVEDCFFYNNRTSGIRLGGQYHGNNRTHVARNCVVVVDDGIKNVAMYPNGGHRVGNLIARWGRPEFNSCHSWIKPSADPFDNWCTVRGDAHTGNAVAMVSGGHVQPKGSRLCGQVNLTNVGNSPTDQPPSAVPQTATAAASGGTDDGTNGGNGGGNGDGENGGTNGENGNTEAGAALLGLGLLGWVFRDRLL